MITADGFPHCPFCDQVMNRITKNLAGETYGCEKCVNGWTVFLHHAPPMEPRRVLPMGQVGEVKAPKP